MSAGGADMNRNVLKKIVALASIVGSALALYNVYSDVGPLQKTAEAVACGAAGCANLIGLERSPVSATFRFQVQRNKSDTAQVRCSRALILLGEYSCTKEFGPN